MGRERLTRWGLATLLMLGATAVVPTRAAQIAQASSTTLLPDPQAFLSISM